MKKVQMDVDVIIHTSVDALAPHRGKWDVIRGRDRAGTGPPVSL